MSVRHQPVAQILCCVLVLSFNAAAQEHHAQHHWDYGKAEGPTHWGELEPDYAACKDGHHQSPIDIRTAHKSDLPPIQFDYKPSALRVIDNGHTVMVDYEPGSFISIAGKKYALKQFHFHRPSEEMVKGKRYEMVAHLVHADEAGHLAVVAVLFEKRDDNPVVREIWEHLPKAKEKEELVNGIQIDAASLLPTDHGYYTFSGSLTTPPCSEHVTWFVLKNPVAISAAEIEQFSKLYPQNVRPTQPLYGRTVLETK